MNSIIIHFLIILPLIKESTSIFQISKKRSKNIQHNILSIPKVVSRDRRMLKNGRLSKNETFHWRLTITQCEKGIHNESQWVSSQESRHRPIFKVSLECSFSPSTANLVHSSSKGIVFQTTGSNSSRCTYQIHRIS